MMHELTAGNQRATYAAVVQQWARERELLGYVQPYTAKRSAQKALLFEPWIGSLEVAEIESQRIIDVLMTLSISGGRKGEGLSTTTLRAAHLAGTQALDWAIARGLAERNPFKSVPRPKAVHKQASFLTPGQAQELMGKVTAGASAAMDAGNACLVSYNLAVCLALATGMRRGEFFALGWSDINPELRLIGVSKAVKAGGEVGEPKSSSSVRTVAIGPNLAGLLKRVCAWQRKQLHPLGPRNVFCNSVGERVSMSSFDHWWRSWADHNGYQGLRFHDLRHTHATILIAQGVDVKTVQLRLGHASADITMSIYAHALPQSDGAAASALDAALFA